MNFTFTTAANNNGHKTGLIKEGAINELGEVTYHKDEHFDEDHYPSFEEIVANEVLRRIYGNDQPSMSALKEEAFNHGRSAYGLSETKKEERPKEPKKNNCSNAFGENARSNDLSKKDSSESIKIGVDVKNLTDEEFIEYTRRRVQNNKEHERFMSIKSKIRASLEGRTYNEKAFDLFVKLHDIDKRGFFNRTKEDEMIIAEAIRLYGTA